MTRRKPPAPTNPQTLTDADLDAMAQVTHEVRVAEARGGQCGFVAEILANTYGWDMYGGVYHSPDGHPIGDHVWNVHAATGTIIDATADQFGEGAQVRVLTPGDPLHARYTQADSDEQEERWLDQARHRRDAEGDYWWVPGGMSNADVVGYRARERDYETGVFDGP